MSFKKYDNVYIADTACVLGEITLYENVNIWYGASIRGDVAPITIGKNSNVQDNATIHCDGGFPNVIGESVTIGHNAVCHGESIGNGCLIGMNCTILGHTKIGNNCIVAAGAVVPPGLVVPDNMVVMGVPGKIMRETNAEERAFMEKNPPHYVKLAKLHYDCKTTDKRFITWAGNI
ncbi:gamma carbonic anhydrase family protein [Poriferisphaera sp. WC338]|uniref:gamma carbonic anhydrase family protein n=1 Tax=Poriferisphaera sp. WC338 TaxID=3425129 RepID=UPI003D8198D6